jgi:hypothetical protein
MPPISRKKNCRSSLLVNPANLDVLFSRTSTTRLTLALRSGFGVRVKLTKKSADMLCGSDLWRVSESDVLNVSARDGEILLASGWAVAVDKHESNPDPSRDGRSDSPSKIGVGRPRQGAPRDSDDAPLLIAHVQRYEFVGGCHRVHLAI